MASQMMASQMSSRASSVVTSCGHLFCWACLYKWKREHQMKPCPLCKIMLRFDNIIPIYECQDGSSSGRTNSRDPSSIPPRPSQPAGDSGVPGTESPSLQGAHDRHLEFLRSRAQAEFRALREFHSPWSAVWTSEAFNSWRGRGRTESDPLDDDEFVSNVYDPFDLGFSPWWIGSFHSSWLAYYAALNSEASETDQDSAFIEAWCRHFYRLWNRAGRPRAFQLESGLERDHLRSSAIVDDEPDVLMCSICEDRPRAAVVVSCGHLFCWSCLFTSSIQKQENSCPVCKIKFGDGNIIPIYGCSSSSSAHGSIPPRPSAPLGTH